ncbi:universal stress protein [Rhodococcus sp. DMU2021]|uniref:universal stress protein n=1 Tax=Rhodococcus sp. DMU2021 TaxID=2866997 RepID=UPI0027E32814|nr:universal stress protein [Rhodococcus sp. DMU2021]
MITAHHPIVAGVDGSRASLQAVVWAAREAERCRLPLSLVTIVSVRNTFGVPIGMPAGFFE